MIDFIGVMLMEMHNAFHRPKTRAIPLFKWEFKHQFVPLRKIAIRRTVNDTMILSVYGKTMNPIPNNEGVLFVDVICKN